MLASILINLNTEEDFRNECLGFYEYLGYPNNDSSVIKEIDTLYFVVCNDKFKPTYNEKSISSHLEQYIHQKVWNMIKLLL